MNSPAYQKVTDHIMSQLEKGLIPWKNPINKNNMMPKNLITGTPYHGVNILSTHFYEVPYFMTFNQASAIEAKIQRGSKAVPIVYWNVNEYKTTSEDGECELKKGFILKYYNVFNVDCISDLPKKYCYLIQEEKRTAPNHKIITAEKIIEGYKDCPPIRNERGTPCYKPGLDEIAIPSIGSFDTSEAYYSTLFHECTHSTGHTKRLGRFKEEDQSFHFGCIPMLTKSSQQSWEQVLSWLKLVQSCRLKICGLYSVMVKGSE